MSPRQALSNCRSLPYFDRREWVVVLHVMCMVGAIPVILDMPAGISRKVTAYHCLISGDSSVCSVGSFILPW